MRKPPRRVLSKLATNAVRPVRLVAALAFVLPVLLLPPAPLAAQSVAEILQSAAERNEARLAGVSDLAIQQEVMGFSTTTYLAKEVVDGHSRLRVHSVDAGPLGSMDSDPGGEVWAELGRFYVDWADRWSLEGRGSVDGQSTYSLLLDDLEGLDLQTNLPGEEMSITYERMQVEMDVDRLVPLRVTIQGEIEDRGETRPATLAMALSDYREIDGYLHPFSTVIETDMASAGVSPEQLAEARQGLEEMRRQLEQVPEGQRQMIERMLGPQMEVLARMVEGDQLVLEMRVTDLRVNAGLP